MTVKNYTKKKNNKKQKRKTTKKKYHDQKGGFLGFNASDLTDILSPMLENTIIPFLPNSNVICDDVVCKKRMKKYKELVSVYQLINIIAQNPTWITSKNIQKIISVENSEDEQLSKLTHKLFELTGERVNPTFSAKCKILRQSEMEEVKILSDYILDCNHNLVNSYNDWYLILLNMVEFDSQFEVDVSNLLKNREIFINFQDLEKEINILKNDKHLKKALQNKLILSSSKPRTFWDTYITSNVTWDSNKKCLSCPDKSCLLYINDNYYDFLVNGNPKISKLHKIYILIMCETRACIFSKYLSLEGLRIYDKNFTKVKSLLRTIYQNDSKTGNISLSESSVFDYLSHQPLPEKRAEIEQVKDQISSIQNDTSLTQYGGAIDSENTTIKDPFARNTSTKSADFKTPQNTTQNTTQSLNTNPFDEYNFGIPSSQTNKEVNPFSSTSNQQSSEPFKSTAEPLKSTQTSGSTDEPLKSTAEPFKSTAEPFKSTPEPLKSTAEPFKSTAEPFKSTPEPLKSTTEPFKSTAEPFKSTPKPLNTTTEPLKSTAEPLNTTTEPLKSTAEQPLKSTTEQPLESTTEQPLNTTQNSESTAEQPLNMDKDIREQQTSTTPLINPEESAPEDPKSLLSENISTLSQDLQDKNKKEMEKMKEKPTEEEIKAEKELMESSLIKNIDIIREKLEVLTIEKLEEYYEDDLSLFDAVDYRDLIKLYFGSDVNLSNMNREIKILLSKNTTNKRELRKLCFKLTSIYYHLSDEPSIEFASLDVPYKYLILNYAYYTYDHKENYTSASSALLNDSSMSSRFNRLMKTVVNDTDYSWIVSSPEMFDVAIYPESFCDDLFEDIPRAFVSDDVLEKIKASKEIDLSTSVQVKESNLTGVDSLVQPDKSTVRFNSLSPQMCQQMLDIIEKNRYVTQSDLFKLDQCENALKSTMNK